MVSIQIKSIYLLLFVVIFIMFNNLNKLVSSHFKYTKSILYQMSMNSQKPVPDSNQEPIKKFYIKKLVPDATIPVKGTQGSAGYDLCAIEEMIIPSNEKGKVKTGLAFMIPPNTYARIAPRSGLAWKNFINVGAGVID